jgi:hypothetical protein
MIWRQCWWCGSRGAGGGTHTRQEQGIVLFACRSPGLRLMKTPDGDRRSEIGVESCCCEYEGGRESGKLFI